MAVFDPNYYYWNGRTYSAGDFVFSEFRLFRCIQGHTSDLWNRPYGTNGLDYWEEALVVYSDPAKGGTDEYLLLYADNYCFEWSGSNGYDEGQYVVHDTDGVGVGGPWLLWQANTDIEAPVGEPPTPNDPPGTSPDWDYVGTCQYIVDGRYMQPSAFIEEWDGDEGEVWLHQMYMNENYTDNWPYAKLYKCILAHNISSVGSTSEPGVGATWETYWEVIADGPYIPLGHFEMQGSFNIRRSANHEQQGGFLVCDADGKLIFRIAAFQPGGATYADMDEFAVDQGYEDEAELLSELGYSTSLELAQAKGFATVENYLAAQSYPTVEETLNELGITLG
jgi:hypothetical protein